MSNETEIRFGAETLRSLAFGSIGAAYAPIGTVTLNPSRLLYISNLTDVTLTFSFDGTNDHFVLPTEGFLLLDIASNRLSKVGLFLAQGKLLYVKETSAAAASGTVYFSVFFGE